jgi:hypothetical protein
MGDASIRPELKLTITATTANKTAAAPAPMITTGGTHKIINAAKSPACPVLAVDQEIAAYEPLAKAAMAPKIAPHPADLPTMLLMVLRPVSTPAGGLSKEPRRTTPIAIGPFASINPTNRKTNLKRGFSSYARRSPSCAAAPLSNNFRRPLALIAVRRIPYAA